MKGTFATRPPAGSKLVRDWNGRKAKTLRDMRNGLALIPAGTVVTIEGAGGGRGFTLLTDACKCCGVRVYLTGANPDQVEEIAQGAAEAGA